MLLTIILGVSGLESQKLTTKVFTIHLTNGQIHSTFFKPFKTLREALEQLCQHRIDISIDDCIARDLEGNILDQNKTLGDLAVTEITFGRDESGEEADEDIGLDVISKVQSIESSHIDNIDDFMLNGYILEGDTLETEADKDKDYTIRGLRDIVQKMKNLETGVPVRSRRLKLRNYENCFVASEAVEWLIAHINVSREEAVSLGKALEKEGFISHVTLRYNFDDSKDLFFRFSDETNHSLMGLDQDYITVMSPRIQANKLTVEDIKNQRGYHLMFWEAPKDISKKIKRSSLKSNMFLRSLTSYVPNVILRSFIHSNEPNPVTPPFSEKFPAAVLFADISGFTPLTEKLGKMGSRGVEILTSHLNEYFGRIINLIFNHGGDIVKFAGDALVAIWPTSNPKGLGYSTLLASLCALSLQEHLSSYDADGNNLTLHIGVGAGEIWGIVVGGVKNHMEFLIAGQPLEQVSLCEAAAKPGEVYISSQAASLIKPCIEVSVDYINKRGTSRKKKFTDWNSSHTYENFRLEGITNQIDLPPSIAIPHFKRMKKCITPFIQPAVLAHLNSGSPDHFLAELRTVSVIFVNLGLNFEPSKLEKLQDAVRLMQESVYFYEGTIRQFIIDDKGSVLIAALGLPPFSHEDDPCRAVQTALKIQRKISSIGLTCSIGVTTGKAFCGAVGSEERREYAMVGDIVNLAARLMAKANDGILCDKVTYSASKSRITFKTLQPISVKGKIEPIDVYSPIRESRGRQSMLINKTSRDALIMKEKFITLRNPNISEKILGKDEEFKVLREQLQWLKDTFKHEENTKFILIEGEAGSGKSFLLSYFRSFARKSSFNAVTGSAYSIESSTAYFAWREIFVSIFNWDSKEMDDVSVKSESIMKVLLQHSPDLIEHLPLLNNILGVDFEENEKTKQMSGQVRAEKLETLILTILQHKGESIFIFENAQWLDSASWRLINAAAQTLKHCLIIATTRPIQEETASSDLLKLLSYEHTITLNLRNLDMNETAELVSSRLSVKSIPKELSEVIFEKSGGNPLLSVELADALLKANKITITKQGECRVTQKLTKQLSSIGIPNTLRGLITSKIDQLPQTQQMILKLASVIGRVFEIELLQDVMYSTFNVRLDNNALLNDLLSLEAMDLICIKTEEPLSYSFQQNITQEVVYELMLYSQRQQIHGNIAEWFESNMSDQPSIVYTSLAHHYKMAEVLDRAILYFSKSGELALSNYANREAVNFFTESLDLQEKLNKRDNKSKSSSNWYVLSWKRQLGQAYYNLGLLEKAISTLEDALSTINEPIRLKVGSELLSKLKFKKANERNKDRKLKKIKPTTIDSQSVITREYILILLTIAKANYYECKKDVVTYCNLMALKKAEEMGIAKELCESYGGVILTCGMHGKHELVQMYIDAGTSLANTLKSVDVEPLMSVTQTAAMYYTGISQWDKARLYFESVISLAMEAGNARILEESYIFLSGCFFLQGKIKESLSINDMAVESSQRRGDVQTEILAYTSKARCLISLGKQDLALETLKKVSVILGRGEGYKLDFATEINYHALMATIYVLQRDFELAYSTAETIMKFLDDSEPTAYFTFTGYMTTPEIFLIILQQLLKPNNNIKLRPSITPQIVQAKIQKSLKHLQNFAKTFNLAEPRLLLCQGLLESLSGKNDKALSIWRKSAALAQEKQMVYDEGLALFRIGRCTDVRDKREVVEEKIQAYDKAIDILTNLGAVYTELLLE